MEVINADCRAVHEDLLLNELNYALESAKQIRHPETSLNLIDADKNVDNRISSWASMRFTQLGNKLQELIVQDSRFPSDTKFINVGNGALGFYPRFAVGPLIKKALELDSAEKAIDWLLNVLKAESAKILSITAMWGAPIDKELEITDNIKIMPLADLPESYNKRWLMGSMYTSTSNIIASALNYSFPQSALVISELVAPFIYSANDYDKYSCSVAAHHDHYEKISNITSVLTVIGPRAVIRCAHWRTVDDSNLEQATEINSRALPHIEILPHEDRTEVELDAILAKELILAYLGLDSKTRKIISIALGRLNNALIRQNIGDRAVELSVALEALTGDGTTNEMTHKVKVRTVRLLGGSNAERAKNAKILSHTYTIRSSMVHTGSVSSVRDIDVAGTKMDPSAVVIKATKLCSEMIIKIIRAGKIPNWPEFDITENEN